VGKEAFERILVQLVLKRTESVQCSMDKDWCDFGSKKWDTVVLSSEKNKSL